MRTKKSFQTSVKSLSLWLVIGFLGVFAVGYLAFAAGNSIVNNYYGNTNVDQTASADQVAGNTDSPILGASGDNNLSTYLDQDITTNGITVDGLAWIPKLNSTIVIPLDFAQATSSATGATTLILGKYRYTGTEDLECSLSGIGTFLDVEGLVPYRIDYKITTSTCLTATAATCGTGVYSFNNTTTYSILSAATQATSTDILNPLNADDNEGDFTREVFKLSTNDWFVVTGGWTAGGFSTSTMPTAATQGLTASGNAQINCVVR